MSRLADPGVGVPMPGLHKAPDAIEFGLDPAYWVCCQGQGSQILPQGVRFCQLLPRLRQVNALARQFASVWKRPLPPEALTALTPRERVGLGSWFTGFSRGLVAKGRVFQIGYLENAPSLKLWSMALVAAWHYGQSVFMVSLGVTPGQDLLPMVTGTTPPPVVFVEQKALFANHLAASDFLTIATWCDNAATPLWLDLLAAPAPSDGIAAGPITTVRERAKRRLNKLASRPPLSFLSSEALSRLNAVSDDVAKFV